MGDLSRHTESCELCGNRCFAPRRQHDERGFCGAPPLPHVSWHGLHFGEEPPISGARGCANIFFAGCNLKCVYCQNWQISQKEQAVELPLGPGALAELMLSYDAGAQSIGLVSPSPHLLALRPALEEVRKRGLHIPIVYNTSSYETVESLQALDGLVDVYLPDMKYGSNDSAKIYSGVPDYVELSRAAIAEMFRQVGHLELDAEGNARRGLLLRHMILPADRADSTSVLDWAKRELGRELHLSIMAQYRPHHLVNEGLYPELARTITRQEYDFVVDYALGLGFRNLYIQSFDAVDTGNPDFDSSTPFTWD